MPSRGNRWLNPKPKASMASNITIEHDHRNSGFSLIKHGGSFHSCVKLPEGISKNEHLLPIKHGFNARFLPNPLTLRHHKLPARTRSWAIRCKSSWRLPLGCQKSTQNWEDSKMNNISGLQRQHLWYIDVLYYIDVKFDISKSYVL